MLDFESLLVKQHIHVITNNDYIAQHNKETFIVTSDKSLPNDKFIVSKYLTSVFLSLPLKKVVRDKFYSRIRQLLLEKLKAVHNRLDNKKENNRETSTFLRFSYGSRVWYLGLYIPCSF